MIQLAAKSSLPTLQLLSVTPLIYLGEDYVLGFKLLINVTNLKKALRNQQVAFIPVNTVFFPRRRIGGPHLEQILSKKLIEIGMAAAWKAQVDNSKSLHQSRGRCQRGQPEEGDV